MTHTYTWDADGNNLSVDSSVSMIYDAMDRMIEQTRGSSHQQIVYDAGGMKLALMNGQTLTNAFVKLPGGASAVYNSSGLAYYRHSDHLGSSRLSTTPSRTKYYDVAYAPYGEDYNGSGTTPDLAFTGQNQDSAGGGWSSNLYDFMMREYRTAHGRWTSPDPAGLGAVSPASPQSWNRYAYVINNPLTFTDALGLQHGSGGSGQCDQCDQIFEPIWIDQWFPFINGMWASGNDGYYGGASSPCSLDGLSVPCGSVGGFGSTFLADARPKGSGPSAPGMLWVPADCITTTQTSPYGTVPGSEGTGCESGYWIPLSFSAGILYPGMNGAAQYAKWATRGKPPTNFPNVQDPIWPQGAPPEVNPPVEMPDIPWYKSVPLKLLELFDALGDAAGDLFIVVDPCLMNPYLPSCPGNQRQSL